MEDTSLNTSATDNRNVVGKDIMNIIDNLPDRDKKILIFRLGGYEIEDIDRTKYPD